MWKKSENPYVIENGGIFFHSNLAHKKQRKNISQSGHIKDHSLDYSTRG